MQDNGDKFLLIENRENKNFKSWKELLEYLEIEIEKATENGEDIEIKFFHTKW